MIPSRAGKSFIQSCKLQILKSPSNQTQTSFTLEHHQFLSHINFRVILSWTIWITAHHLPCYCQQLLYVRVLCPKAHRTNILLYSASLPLIPSYRPSQLALTAEPSSSGLPLILSKAHLPPRPPPGLVLSAITIPSNAPLDTSSTLAPLRWHVAKIPEVCLFDLFVEQPPVQDSIPELLHSGPQPIPLVGGDSSRPRPAITGADKYRPP